MANNKVLFFYNPVSGSGMFKHNIDVIIERFQNAGMQIVPVRAARGEALDRALKNMDQSKFRQIIAAGGDGTINICVNLMIKYNIDLPLAIFPSGTANDFAYYFELPTELDKMIDIALGDVLSYADVGKANERYFINVTALGNMVDASQRTDPQLKNTLGVGAYYLRGFMDVATLKPIPVKITTENGVYEEEMFFMLVMNGESAGGFKKMSPGSLIADGKLDVMLFRKMPKIELAPLLVSLLNGNHADSKHVLYLTAEKILIESTEDVPTDIDGEKGDKLPIEFSILHKRLRVFTQREII